MTTHYKTSVYRVEEQPNEQGFHVIHRGQCPVLNYVKCSMVIGRYSDPEIAREMVRQTYYAVIFCEVCCPELAPICIPRQMMETSRIVIRNGDDLLKKARKRKLH